MFKEFAQKISKQIEIMQEGELFEVEIDKQELWELYLSSFPDGSNPIYKERTEHDCNCCKNFIRDIGNMISIKNGEVMTVWDIDMGGHFQVVADVLRSRIRKYKIKNVYTHESQKVGVETSNQLLENGTVKSWNHFYGSVPRSHVGITPTTLSETRSTVDVFERGLEELTIESADVVLELISQNSLYRGEEFKESILIFKDLKKKYNSLKTYKRKQFFLWSNYKAHGARIRNTAIGTLLQDVSAGDPLDVAVKAFESKVAPTNYKRPTPVITKKMVEDAMSTIRDEGIEQSLYRRFATIEDISVNDILFADRSVKPHMRGGLEASLLSEVKSNPKDFSKVNEISISDFIANVLPGVDSMEVCVDNSHQSNLMSLIAPMHDDSPKLFKWNNPFSWSYNGNVTDSIKQRVKAAGGNVEGYLRASLSWFNFDDLDLHVKEPNGNTIYFGNKYNGSTGGNLDVDMNAHSGKSRDAVENITWPEQRRMQEGVYEVLVHNFCKRESIDVGFEVEIECQGELYKYNYKKPVAYNKHIGVARLVFNGNKIIEILKGPHVEEGSTSKEVWGVKTNEYHKVSLLTLSPNHWGDEQEGNKHYIFVLDGCKNNESTRGFYNEFLPSKYNKYRKVFEILGDKTKCAMSEKQLSGLGFSSTKENELICRITGNINRVLKIKF